MITRQELTERGFTESNSGNVLNKFLSKQTTYLTWIEKPSINRNHKLSIEAFITDKDEIFSIHLLVSPGDIDFKLEDNSTIEDIDHIIRILNL